MQDIESGDGENYASHDSVIPRLHQLFDMPQCCDHVDDRRPEFSRRTPNA